MRVGYIGLGSQGGPMARRIVDAGFETTLWARRPETLEPYQGTGTSFASSVAELGETCDLVCICVVNDDDVREVVEQLLTTMRDGTVIAVQSTVHPQTCIALATDAAARGVTLIDAPVSGGGPAAAEGRLLVMAAGDPDVVERCRPVFETYGNPVVHVGPLGAGQLAKLVNNVLFVAHLGVAADAYALGEGFGIPRSALKTVLAHGSGSSFAIPLLEARELPAMGELAGPLFRKDVDLAADVAASASITRTTLLDIANDALARMGQPAS